MGGKLLERLRSYKRMDGPRGESHNLRNLDYWSARASENSNMWHRAKSGPVELTDTTGMGVPDGAKKIPARFTGNDGSKPYWPNEGEKMRKAALRDVNDVGSTFMPGVRRSRE
jgi:hypothetical protein